MSLCKERLTENNVTIREISENTGEDETLIMLLLDRNNGIIDAFSDILEMTNVQMRVMDRKMSAYSAKRMKKNYRILRNIEPRAVMYYSIAEAEFYNFKWATHTIRRAMTKERKEEIVNEMAEFLNEELEKRHRN